MTKKTQDQVNVCGNPIQYDGSGVGHNWRPCSEDHIHAGIKEEIAAEILDGDMESCDDYVASNGQHYRW